MHSSSSNEGHTGWVDSVAFRQVVKFWLLVGERHNNKLGLDGNTLKLWNVKNGNELRF